MQDLLKEVECRLAICYEELGDTNAELAAYRRAARIDPLWVPARLGIAATLASLGQIDDALEEYDQIGRLNGEAGKTTSPLPVCWVQEPEPSSTGT